jgi:hypothetical protein
MESLRRAVARMDGKIVLPEHGRWEEARQAWNLAVDQRPAAVALPESAEDVVAVIELARNFGLRVAPQGTGHNSTPLGPLEDTALVKTERMRKVEIDAERRPGWRPASSGSRSSRRRPTMGLPVSRGPRPTWAWSATPSAAA